MTTIGLALGGGALGAAHLALLEELDKADIRVDEVAGASAGAIVGLLYASGGSRRVDEFLEMANATLFTPRNILSSITGLSSSRLLLYKSSISDVIFSDQVEVLLDDPMIRYTITIPANIQVIQIITNPIEKWIVRSLWTKKI